VTLRRRSFSAIATAVASTILISCADTAVRVRGRILDAAGAPRQCVVTVLYRGQTVGEFRVTGAFDETAVFRPSTTDRLTVRGTCYGTRDFFEKEIPVPAKLDAAVDLGNFVFP
jgi:hypothetical protein